MKIVLVFALCWFATSVLMVLFLCCWGDFTPSTFRDALAEFSLSALKEEGCKSGLLGVLFFLFLWLLVLPGCFFWFIVTGFFCGIGRLNRRTRKWFGYREGDENEC